MILFVMGLNIGFHSRGRM